MMTWQELPYSSVSPPAANYWETPSIPDQIASDGEDRQTEWTAHENKLFENALAEFEDENAPGRWEKVAARVPGKTAEEVLKHYQTLAEDVELIESGQTPLPHYMDDDGGNESDDNCAEAVRKVKKKWTVNRTAEQERKKGVPWNEEEHRLFLIGLSKYGKGDWRSISRNCVKTRTPTQVASHAQKYFNRLTNLEKKERRRPSIHDIRSIKEKESSPTITVHPSIIVPPSPTPCTNVMGPTIQPSNMHAMRGGLTPILPKPPSCPYNYYGGLESYMSNNLIGGVEQCPPSIGFRGGFADLPLANMRVGGFGNLTSVNVREGPPYSVYDLPALQRR
ncbi:transcription factor DIVARICATA-like [Magnolia sinica]|uniref:transcription factor DIVARICATA-like n=1 Tax=Magnolia sinica TaxID=86752 RepID=UPI00265891C9|nr:transcription factor DIVARICATA-like [Magnolia sinica]